MNVLLSSCGAKVALTRAWRAAVAERGGQLLAVDAAADSPALFEADLAVRVPPRDTPAWSATLCDLCRRHRIALVVPTADRELLALAALAPRLRAAGTMTLVAPPAALHTCLDKQAFALFCARHAFPLPRTYPRERQPEHFPVFARGGRSGQRVRLDTPALLAAWRAAEPDALIQEWLDEPEYSIDLLLDFAGQPLQAVARRRLRVRGGEACVSQVENNATLTDLVMRLGHALGLIGHNVVQAFWSETAGARLIEVNPRFGGASSLSLAAGLDSPRRLLALLAGDDRARAPRPIRAELMLLRYGADRFVTAADLNWPCAPGYESAAGP